MLKHYNEPDVVLEKLGLTPDDIDFGTFRLPARAGSPVILGSTSVDRTR